MAYFSLVAAGILAGLGTILPPVWFLSIFGIALFAYALENFPANRYWKVFLQGTIFGTTFSAVALIMWWDVLPLTWAGIPGATGLKLIIAYWLSGSAMFGMFFGLFSVVYILYAARSP